MNEHEEILLKQQFHDEMLNVYKRTTKEVKYKPSRRLDLTLKYGGYEAAIKILPTDANTFDFTLLWEAERLDLSVEALVTKERYRGLFPSDVVNFCQKRLDDYQYAPKKLAVEPTELDAFLDTLFEGTVEEPTKKNETAPMVTTSEPSPLIPDVGCSITKEQWCTMLNRESVFTAINKDLIAKIAKLTPKQLTFSDLSILEGYSPAYPFFDVLTSLCKRIKAYLKLPIPKDDSGNVVWWQLIFRGTVEDKKHFQWYLRQELVEALLEAGYIDETKGICETKDIPQDQDVPTAQAIPEDEAIPEAQAIPETQAIPKAQAIPETQAIPEAQAIPETQAIPEAQAIPETTEILWDALYQACLDYYGPICDCCGFDFGYTYGEAFDGFIHIHCLNPSKVISPQSIDPIKDLIPICYNCKAVITSKQPHYTLDEVKVLLKH